ncbi:MAG: S8 family serine peptidase [candidate division WOR-3 bacterium]|nr:S8 family serine peptidase [candidate division WOR-3 bacterium]
MMPFVIILFCDLYNFRAPHHEKIDPRCFTNEFVRAWVLFTDKGVKIDHYQAVLKSTTETMHSDVLRRRMLRKGIIDYGDIPVREEYIEEIQNEGGILLYRSKWLNAASFLIHRDDLHRIADFEFVYRIIPVSCYNKINDTEISLQDTIGLLTDRQLKMFNIDSLHKLGVFGSGVKIGFLDTGLRRKHNALENLKVIAEYDFLSGDQIFLENTPVTGRYGVYTEMLFHKRSDRIELFLIGDTSNVYMPARDILYTYSRDNGETWSELKKITSNPYNNWVTEINLCGDDTTFLFFKNRSGLNFVVLDTGIIAGPMTIVSGSFENPRSLHCGDTIYLFYRDKYNIFLRKGNINGFPQQTIVVTGQANIKLADAFVSGLRMGLLYYQFPEDSIFLVRSSIPADTFDVKFTGFIGKDSRVVCSGDTIFLLYKDCSNPPFYRIAFTTSYDFGDSFKPIFYLSDNLNSAGKISISKLGNKIVVLWESNGRLYQRVSYDNGVSFTNLDSLSQEFVYLPLTAIISSEIKKFYLQRGDGNTDGYNPSDPKYFHPRHGTEMVGIVGGYSVNNYIGVAPGAQLIIAKTENPDSLYEFPVEEDTYIAGLEWCESKGADIISSSLGYIDWYQWPEDYDGKTSPASIAVYEATKRGVIVVTAAGNVAVPQLVIPGDAINAITVGGIDSTFQRWRYSGHGPTADGRLKPEIVCLAAAPVVVNPDESNSYLLSFGTSGATALVAGICALLLEGHPRWNGDSLRKALFSTASFANSPSDTIGYGWPDAVKAFFYSPPEIKFTKGCKFLTPFPNPFITSVHQNIYIPFVLNTETFVELRIYSINGRLIKKIEIDNQLAPGRYTDTSPLSPNSAFIWDGKDENGNRVSAGIYYCLLYTYGAGNDVTKIVVVR